MHAFDTTMKRITAALCWAVASGCLPPLPDKHGETAAVEHDTDGDEDDDDVADEPASGADGTDGMGTTSPVADDQESSSSSSTTDDVAGSSGDDGSEGDGSSGPPVAVCGNGVVDDGEVCDGLALGGTTCGTLGYSGGTLSCAFDCTEYDTTACTSSDGNCCTAHGGLGCDVQSIETCVCGLDAYCCDSAWDEQCVGEAIDYCSASCS